MENNTNTNIIDSAQEVVEQLATAALILTRRTTPPAPADQKSLESLEELMATLEGCHFDGSVEMIAELVEEFSSIARLDVVNLFEQIIFCWIVGCNEMDASSFALLDNYGVTSLAPLPATCPGAILAAEGQDESTLTINGKRKNLRRADFEAAMRHMGLKDRIIRITIEKMNSSHEKWREIITSSTLPSAAQERLQSVIATRLRAIAPTSKNS